MTDKDWARERAVLARRLATAGHRAEVVDAFARIPRHLFVPEPERSSSYEDRALPIGEGQTISQPSMIAVMLDALRLKPSFRVLEVGAGSGYAAALLGAIVNQVFAIELSPVLARRAAETLDQVGASNVQVVCADGRSGLAERAPFDAILVSAAPRSVPPALVEQLAPGARLAIPVGERDNQVLRVGTKTPKGMEWFDSVPCLFVPLLDGRDGRTGA